MLDKIIKDATGEIEGAYFDLAEYETALEWLTNGNDADRYYILHLFILVSLFGGKSNKSIAQKQCVTSVFIRPNPVSDYNSR